MPRRSPGIAASAARRRDEACTEVELTWIEQRLEHWIRFGRSAGDRIVNRHIRIVRFRPDAVFALVRWSANDFGTIFSRIDIARAVSPGEPCTSLPLVKPGGELLLSITGWPKVSQVLGAIDAVEAIDIDACDAAPDHWRHVNNRIAAGQTPRAYTAERHAAWLRRRELGL